MEKVVFHMNHYGLLLRDVLLSVFLCRSACVLANCLLYLSLYFEQHEHPFGVCKKLQPLSGKLPCTLWATSFVVCTIVDLPSWSSELAGSRSNIHVFLLYWYQLDTQFLYKLPKVKFLYMFRATSAHLQEVNDVNCTCMQPLVF